MATIAKQGSVLLWLKEKGVYIPFQEHFIIKKQQTISRNDWS